MTFDAETWRNEDLIYTAPHPRQQMLKSVRNDVLKDGMTAEEVVGILGPATDTDKFAEHGLVYWLGPEPGMLGVDSQWLLIDFDGQGGLESTSVTTD